jgi:4-amino-4-deoxy-L-arabinose transferase-like glycosyltransferase
MTALQNKTLYPMLFQVVIFYAAWVIWEKDWLLALLIVSGFVSLVGGLMMVIFWAGTIKLKNENTTPYSKKEVV